MFKKILLLAVAAAVSGCAGRAPAPVAVVQPQDRYMDCAAIEIEVQSNNVKVQQLASDKGLKVAQNVAAGVAGLVVPILWFGMDFQGTADTEIQALAEQRRCGEDTGKAPKVVTEVSRKPRSKPKAHPAAAEPPQAQDQAQEQ